MNDSQSHPVIKGIVNQLDTLTPKGKILGSYIIQNPRKAVFMTTKELSEACGVSEATVVRFVGQLGYGGYGEFLQALRDFVDSGLTLPDRVDLPGMKGPGTDLLHRVVFEEMNNLRQFYEAIDMGAGPDRRAASGQPCRLCDRLPSILHLRLLHGLVADQSPPGGSHFKRQ